MSNATKAATGVDFMFGGQPRKLVFNMRSALLMEKTLGKSMLNGEMLSEPTLNDLMVMVWAMLQNGDKAQFPTFEDVIDTLDFENLPELTSVIQEVFTVATPAADDEKKVETVPTPVA
jgi:hypothetical protein